MHELTSVLEPCTMRIKVREEMKGGKDYVPLGFVEINLSEFAGARETSRRFLLQHSRINATLNITVHTDLVSGPPVFKVPASTASLDAVQEQEQEEANVDTAKIAVLAALRDRPKRKIPATIEATRRNPVDVVNLVLEDIKNS
eukprot:Mycagemm_TRINITY_DN10305_c3_g3::TRINITY_DN10305_c3_g3_i3::g.1310::m.1310 type:complete len:143 gc:universal TRINITY_DN10305_c3_g3_i3:530-102(-)